MTKYYFLGIGGIGMSAITRYFHEYMGMNSLSAATMASRRSLYIPRNSPIWALQSKESRYMAMEYWPTENRHKIGRQIGRASCRERV